MDSGAAGGEDIPWAQVDLCEEKPEEQYWDWDVWKVCVSYETGKCVDDVSGVEQCKWTNTLMTGEMPADPAA